MLLTGSGVMDAERAFTRVTRARRRAAVARRLRRRSAGRARLEVFEPRQLRPGGPSGPHGVAQIPLAAIRGTTEPSKADAFDVRFRPAVASRSRWQRIWLAEHRGVPVPPITVVSVGDGYAVRDGHHRVSVAMARGALSIDAIVQAGPP
jgi:hypothetical protein